jgi:carbamoyl-phosphate synthase small subunit
MISILKYYICIQKKTSPANMALQQKKTAILLLEDGTSWQGFSIGKQGTTTGEICFNTGMTGYQEIYTDPSYFGQIMVNTNAHIGNYGIREEESESNAIKIAGLVCKNFNVHFSRQMAGLSIQEYLERESVVGISDVDTREVVRHIRQKGAMNAIISSEITDKAELAKQLKMCPSMDGLELASKVSTKVAYFFGDSGSGKRVAVLDYGVKQNILRSLAQRGCYLQVFPATTSYEEIIAWNPDGIFLSNGPGDPGAMSYAIDLTKKFLDIKKPLFGICLGHQLLALALGMSTYKMHYGHRGINHPVINKLSGKCEITSQNHGFGVDAESALSKTDLIEITHVNLNDQSIEGFRMRNGQAFSVQYHPEAAPGPHDARYLFDDFITMMN